MSVFTDHLDGLQYELDRANTKNKQLMEELQLEKVKSNSLAERAGKYKDNIRKCCEYILNNYSPHTEHYSNNLLFILKS